MIPYNPVILCGSLLTNSTVSYSGGSGGSGGSGYLVESTEPRVISA
jgi:hypothetical protein